ncbi:dienelactone hydrolase family protein [Candidatus Thioglobus sp.]|uniref:dienelactone hydrolase family protein n=1 Tax=Candidatus Thioglobus sp. TaxID=2026721 RepID=UPI003D10CB7E
MKKILLILSFLLATTSQATIKSQIVHYEDNDVQLKGELYWDDAITGKRPGVMVVHEWWGLNDYAKKRAHKLAKAGYVAFAADMYGDDKVTRHAADAKGWMGQITANTKAWQQRALLGLAQLKNHPLVATEKLAAIGYCFGGATVIQMAYAGANLKGVASFHGSLPLAPESSKGKIKAKILAAHGAQDQFVPAEAVLDFSQSLIAAEAQWEVDIYGAASHSFTNPNSADYKIPQLKYDAQADKRSWDRLMSFFEEIF